MKNINLYIYNNIDDPEWEEEICGKCGHVICEVKGTLVRRVHSENAPVEVFKADTAYIRIMCRSCKVKTNLMVHSFTRKNIEEGMIL